MNAKRPGYVLLMILAAAAAMPAWGQTLAPAAGPADGVASIPDFPGLWWHPSLPGFEPLASGPTSLTNRSRRNGVSNYDQLVGDYTNPILKQQAAEIVKNFGELSLKGITFPSPANQCWPEPVPYIYKNFAMLIFQQPDKITIIYDQMRIERLDGGDDGPDASDGSGLVQGFPAQCWTCTAPIVTGIAPMGATLIKC